MSTPHARNIVRKLLAANTKLRIQDLYTRGLSEFPATPFPHPPPPKQYLGRHGELKPPPPPAPNPGHPFRSKSYLKDKVLPELVATGEIKRLHEIVPPTPGLASSKKRITRSKNAMDVGGVDVWQWQLDGPQAATPEPLLEEEPIPESHDWYQPNELFPTIGDKAKNQKTERDPYGSGRWDHLNTRKQNARFEKLRLEKEWVKNIELARIEGARAAEAQRKSLETN
ncbi:hypothetical protein ACGC1H_004488 [Rhizoctonia solani]|uniref:Uncharacterized protein n=1 Tax=Rhizoctonia solani TaxID=456999 RepID=A0A8H2XWC2_9AGAM|nr:unnamed protein product [Rhizoctonia solani]